MFISFCISGLGIPAYANSFYMPYNELVSHLLQGQEPVKESGMCIATLPDGRMVVEVYEISVKRRIVGVIG